MSREIVTVRNLTVEWGGVRILDDHTFSILQDDFLGVIGPNGGGKTTLLKTILGLVRPTRGEIQVFGMSPRAARQQVGYVPQLSPFDRDFPISVRDVVLMGRLCKRPLFSRYTHTDRAAAEAVLEKVGMADFRERPIGRLSGGQRQRVFIARALAGQPRLLLLDEPTASVDPQMKAGIYELLKELRREMAIVLVSHDMGVISSYVDKIACLNGRMHYHQDKEITAGLLEEVYGCPVDIIAHGVPHRVLKEHSP